MLKKQLEMLKVVFRDCLKQKKQESCLLIYDNFEIEIDDITRFSLQKAKVYLDLHS